MRRDRLLLAALLALGAFLRLHALGSMEFKADEQEALNLGIRLLADRPWATAAAWPAAGMPSSNGIANAPLFNWIMAAFWGLTHDPVRATALLALCNVLCLYPLYRWARRSMDEDRSLIFLGVLALSPFAVLYSRKLWTQDLLLPALTLLVWALTWMRSERTFWRGAGTFTWASLLVTQLHQSGPIFLVCLAAAIGVEWWIDRRGGKLVRPGRPEAFDVLLIASGLCAFAFFWIPYAHHLLSLPHDAFANRPRALRPIPELLRKLLAQLAPTDLLGFFRDDRDRFFREGGWPLRAAAFAVAVATGAVLAARGLWSWFRSPRTVPSLGLAWILVVVVFALARIPTNPHYVLILAPLPALLLAGGFEREQGRWPTAVRALRWTHVASLGALTLATILWLDARGGARGDYGVAYRVRAAQAGALATGVVEPASIAPGTTCHPVPAEVEWIAGQAGTGPDAALRLCDGWDDGVYRWSLAR